MVTVAAGPAAAPAAPPTTERAAAPASAAPAGASARRGPHPGLLLAGWVLLSWGIAHVNGYYSGVSITLTLLGAVALVLAVLRGDRGGRWLVPAAIVSVAGLELVTPVVHLQTSHPTATGLPWLWGTVLAGLAAAATGVLLLLALRGRSTPWPTLVAIGVAAVAADLLVVVSAADPRIDVWTLLQASASGLTHGQNLYTQTWPHSTGLTDVYPYLPGSTVLTFPAWLLTGDVRAADLVALAAAAVVASRLLRHSAGSATALRRCLPVLPLLLVAYPRAVLVPEDAYTEPLLLALLLGMVLAVRRGRSVVAVLCFALALASKQHVALLVPVAAWWPAFGWRRTAASVGVALAVVAPWLVADPTAFWHDTVTSTLRFPVLPTALDLPALLVRHGVTVGFAVTGAMLLAAYLLGAVRLPRTEQGFVTGCALVLLAVDVTNKQTFFNHWTLVTGLVVVAVGAPGGADRPAARAVA